MSMIDADENGPSIMKKFTNEAISDIVTMFGNYVNLYGLARHYKAENERLEEELANAGELCVEEHTEGCEYCEVDSGLTSYGCGKSIHVGGAAESAQIRFYRDVRRWFLHIETEEGGSTEIEMRHCPFCGRTLP